MDAFETSVGYRSLLPKATPPEKHVVQKLSERERLRLACDIFDAELAEVLRSTGEWHWQVEITEIVADVAELVSSGSATIFEQIRTALLHYYADRYRVPSGKEFRVYLRGKKESPLEGTDQETSVYIDTNCDQDNHGLACDCGECVPTTGKSYRCRIYDLTDAPLFQTQEEFGDWLLEQEVFDCAWGPSEAAAVHNAWLVCEQQGYQVLDPITCYPVPSACYVLFP